MVRRRGFGEVERRSGPAGVTYRARYTMPDGSVTGRSYFSPGWIDGIKVTLPDPSEPHAVCSTLYTAEGQRSADQTRLIASG